MLSRGLFSRRFVQACGSARNASTLVVAEQDASGKLSAASLSAITAAKALSQPIHAVVYGNGCGDAAAAASKAAGVESVDVLESDTLKHGEAERTVPVLLNYLQNIKSSEHTHVVMGSTSVAKNLVPRLGALMDISPVTDIIEIKDKDTFVRPIYAGNALATVKSGDKVKLMTVRTTCFEPVANDSQDACAVNPVETGVEEGMDMSKHVSVSTSGGDRPDLTSAKVVISGGRAMKNGENFDMLYKLADKLQGAVGASRAAVDAGFVSNELQVGQTGKVVAPDLYVAVGISGAIQHLAGMKDSKTIVAINKDPEAPIFQVADYGLVGDLFTTVPELDQKV